MPVVGSTEGGTAAKARHRWPCMTAAFLENRAVQAKGEERYGGRTLLLIAVSRLEARTGGRHRPARSRSCEVAASQYSKRRARRHCVVSSPREDGPGHRRRCV